MEFKIRYIANLVLFFSFFLNSATAKPSQGSTYIIHAETYYWLGIQDKGDPAAFEKALQYLNQAENQLRTGDSKLDSAEVASLQQQIALFHSDLDEQLKIAQNTFIGRFPLARFMGKSPFVSSKAFGSFEIFEDAGEVAASRAAAKLGGLFYNHFFGDLQIPLIVVSENNAFPDMESKVRVILKNSSRIKVYQTQYLKKYLSNGEMQLLQSQKPDAELIEKVSGKLKTENFAITSIRKLNQVNDIHFYSFNTLVFNRQSDSPLQATILYELIRDKRGLNAAFIIVVMVLLILSVIFYLLYYKKNMGNYPGLKKTVSGPVMAFVVGLFTAMIALGIFYNLQPDSQDYYAYTFWWIPAAFIVIFIAPLFIIRNYILNLSYYQKAEVSSSRLAPYFVSAVMGVSAYLSLGLLLYHETYGYMYVSTLIFSFGIAAYISGKTLGSLNPLPGFLALLAIILVPFTGLWVSSAYISGFILPFLAFSVLLFFTLKYNRVRIKIKHTQQKENSLAKEVDIPQLISMTENPPYLKTTHYLTGIQKTESFLNGGSSVLCITGQEGYGKTAMAKKIIADLQNQINASGKECLLLDAQCLEKSDIPYQPVQQALIEYINFIKTEDAQNNINEIENALDKLVGSFVPFSSLLKSGKQAGSGTINSQAELFFYIAASLKELSKKYYLVVYIDDLHWADSATLDLLNYLHHTFKGKQGLRILFLYTSRPSNAHDMLFKKEDLHPIEAMNQQERIQLLTEGMGIEKETAAFILSWTGNQGNKKGGLFWLFKVIEQLARNNHLMETRNGICLSAEVMKSGKIPIPDEFANTMREELNKLENFEEYIAVAACLGMEFEVSVLALSLGIDRLQCLKTLKYLEKTTSIIYDIPEKDDVFGFTSSFTLETVRNILALTDEGPKGMVKQIVREYHARIASALEKVPENNSLRIASHYYAAGVKYANTAMRFLIKSADYCADIFRFDEARSFLQKAGIEKNYTEDASMYELEIIMVECKISMLEGKHFIHTAEKCEIFQQKNKVTPPFQQLVFARTYYYAHWFKKAEALCRRIMEHDLDDLLKARAYHLLAISLDPTLSEEKMKNLQAALKIIRSIENPHEDYLKALGEIHNSLGEEYTKLCKDASEKKEIASTHFFESIRIKSLDNINDTPGLARAYGGLGRLELYIKPLDIKGALRYFEKDLELSVQIGDVLGQAQMHSNMGKCFILLGEYEKALPAYLRSFELSERTTDKVFALLGQLMVYDHTDWDVGADESLKHLTNIIIKEKSALPNFLKKEMIQFLQNGNKKEMFISLLKELDSPV